MPLTSDIGFAEGVGEPFFRARHSDGIPGKWKIGHFGNARYDTSLARDRLLLHDPAVRDNAIVEEGAKTRKNTSVAHRLCGKPCNSVRDWGRGGRMIIGY